MMQHTKNYYSTCGDNWCAVFQNIVLNVHVFYHKSVKELLPNLKNSEAIQEIEWQAAAVQQQQQ